MADLKQDIVIRIENISKTYKHRKTNVYALRNVSFSVERGDIFALLGPNGAGKTTLIKIILNFVFPDRGTVFLYTNNSKKPISRKKVGYVPEDLSMPGFSNATSFLYFLGRLSGMKEDNIKRKIQGLLDLTGLAQTFTPINKFSKGMKRRLSIAQAILHEPKILILDEPTDGLDPLERERILNLLKDFREQGGTILLCSHVLTEVESLCNEFLILKQGKIVLNSKVDSKAAYEYAISINISLPYIIIKKLPSGCSYIGSGTKKEILIKNGTYLNEVLSLLNHNSIPIVNIERKNKGLSEIFYKYVSE